MMTSLMAVPADRQVRFELTSENKELRTRSRLQSLTLFVCLCAGRAAAAAAAAAGRSVAKGLPEDDEFEDF